MTIGIDDFSSPAGPTSSSVIGPTLGSIAGPTLDSVISPASGSVADPAPNFVTGPAPAIVTSHIAPVVIDLTKSNYFYEKQVMAENLTSSKLYMKRTIWIGAIPFRETGKVWNYMLSISDNTQKAEVAKNLGHQFIFLAEKIGDGYQQFFNLVKCNWKETGMAKNTMTDIIIRFCSYITANKEKDVFHIKTLVGINKY